MNILKYLFIIAIISVGILIIVENLNDKEIFAQQENKSEQIASLKNAETIDVDGLKRVYLIHLPQNRDHKKSPLVLVLHGGGRGDATKMERTGFNKLADKNDFIVAYGQSYGRFWNDGRKTAKNPEINDVKYISSLIDQVAGKHDVDRNRIYIAGASNGGMMAARMACEIPDKLAAVATVLGNLTTDEAPKCKPKSPIAMLMINGTADPIVPYKGGAIFSFGKQGQQGEIVSVADAAAFWAKNNSCTLTPQVTELPDNNPDDRTTVKREVFANCKSNKPVVIYSIIGGGHTWPGVKTDMPENIVGLSSLDINATEVIWQFFSDKKLNH